MKPRRNLWTCPDGSYLLGFRIRTRSLLTVHPPAGAVRLPASRQRAVSLEGRTVAGSHDPAQLPVTVRNTISLFRRTREGNRGLATRFRFSFPDFLPPSRQHHHATPRDFTATLRSQSMLFDQEMLQSTNMRILRRQFDGFTK